MDMRAEARHERAVQTKGICARVCLFLSRSRSPPSRSPLTFSLPPSRSNPARPSSPACFLFLFLSRPLFFSFRVHTDTRRRVCGRARALTRRHRLPPLLSRTRAQKRGKERGYDIFQDGIFNALARSVTPGEWGPAIGRPRRRSATNSRSLIGRAGP